jgi:hypothetical protein
MLSFKFRVSSLKLKAGELVSLETWKLKLIPKEILGGND